MVCHVTGSQTLPTFLVGPPTKKRKGLGNKPGGRLVTEATPYPH